LMDAEQVEINTLATPGPTVWEPPRDIQISLYPVRQNLIPNPIGRDGLTGWSVTGGSLQTSAAAIEWPAGTSEGFILTSLAVPSTGLGVDVVPTKVPFIPGMPIIPGSGGGNASVTAVTNIASVTPGIGYSFSWYMQPLTASEYISSAILFYSANGSLLSTAPSTLQVESGVGEFTRGVQLNVVAPANAASAKLQISANFTQYGAAHYLGAPLFAPESSLLPYFDANFAPSTDYLFEGAPNNSVSDYYPNLPSKLSRLASVMPEYIPIGSTFSLLVGASIAQPSEPPALPEGAFYDWDDASDTWDNATDTWG
jgi:hypothetical protein